MDEEIQRQWQAVTLKHSEMVASDVKALTFEVKNWVRHQAGQHYDIRLTAEDGYQAERSYSIASAPEKEGEVEFGIQLLENGEVSPYLFQLKPGDQVEIRGPIGRHFVWGTEMDGPLVLIGGGSGMVPLMAMLRHHFNQSDDRREIIFLVSAQDIGRVLYKDELAADPNRDHNLKVVMTLTNSAPPGWSGYKRRVDQEMMEEVFGHLKEKNPWIYVCGPTPFVEEVAGDLVTMGFEEERIKTERFGGG